MLYPHTESGVHQQHFHSKMGKYWLCLSYWFGVVKRRKNFCLIAMFIQSFKYWLAQFELSRLINQLTMLSRALNIGQLNLSSPD